jgi:hypothetical protein
MTGSVDFRTDDPSTGINITRDDPGLDLDTIAACLDVQYGQRVSSVTFLPLGYDLNAAVYKVITEGGTNYFVKFRFGRVKESGLLVPWALSERGIQNVLAPRIHQMVSRAESLGRRLQSRSFDHVLCHADIHAANILVGDDGRIHLIDWDGPLIAPRERDLLFVVGSRIARVVEPREEDLFFTGYGPVDIDPEVLVYYRYERIVEDLGEIGQSILLNPNRSDQMRAEESQLAQSLFAPGGDIDHAETVTLPIR